MQCQSQSNPTGTENTQMSTNLCLDVLQGIMQRLWRKASIEEGERAWEGDCLGILEGKLNVFFSLKYVGKMIFLCYDFLSHSFVPKGHVGKFSILQNSFIFPLFQVGSKQRCTRTTNLQQQFMIKNWGAIFKTCQRIGFLK